MYVLHCRSKRCNEGDCIRHTFNKIGGGKDTLSIADLERFAAEQGMPTSYASKFVSAVLKVPEDTRVVAVGKEQEELVSFESFRDFVKARESALRKAFDLFGESRYHGHALYAAHSWPGIIQAIQYTAVPVAPLPRDMCAHVAACVRPSSCDLPQLTIW